MMRAYYLAGELVGRRLLLYDEVEELNLNDAALQGYGHGVGSIVRAKL